MALPDVPEESRLMEGRKPRDLQAMRKNDRGGRGWISTLEEWSNIEGARSRVHVSLVMTEGAQLSLSSLHHGGCSI